MKISLIEEYPCIIGEALEVGLAGYLIRLAGCNLRCRFCDTTWSWAEGEEDSVARVVDRAVASGLGRALVTGGEPLAQPQALTELLTGLMAEGIEPLLETNGSLSLAPVPGGVVKVVDIKPPGSQPQLLESPFLKENLKLLNNGDQLKVLLCSREDYLWARDLLEAAGPLGISPSSVLLSPAWGMVDPRDLSTWMLEDRSRFRLHLQAHKYIWGDRRGV